MVLSYLENSFLFEIFYLTLCISASIYFIKFSRKEKLNSPPLVKYKLPIIGHSWEYEKDVSGFLEKCRKEYGEIFSIYEHGQVITIVSKELHHEVFNSKSCSFFESAKKRIPLREILGLPTDHMEIVPEIIRDKVGDLMGAFIERTNIIMKKSIDDLIGDSEGPKILDPPITTIQKIIGRVIASIVVGEELCYNEEIFDIFVNYTKEMSELMIAPNTMECFSPWLYRKYVIFGYTLQNNSPRKKLHTLINILKPVIQSRISEERIQGNEWKAPKDILQAFIDHPANNKDNVDFQLIASSVLGIVFAGVFTTSMAANDCLLDYSGRPEYRKELSKEQHEVITDDSSMITLEQLSKMERLDSFIKESLRLTGHVAALEHKVLDSVFTFSNGYQVPKGQEIRIYISPINMDSETFPNPEFDGFRYYKKGSPAVAINRKQITFGMGRHACPGRHLAVNELKVFMSLMIRKFNMSTKSGTRPSNHLHRGIAVPSFEAMSFEKK